jgi:phenylacetate-CoA ligase
MTHTSSFRFAELWKATYDYVSRHSPYYRELFRNVRGVPRLDELPTVDKSAVSERNLDFLCVPPERVIEIVTTSGTTNDPLLWMLTENDLRRLALNERLSFECAGLTAQDTVLIAVAMDRCFIAGQAYWLGLRELGCTSVRVGASSPLFVIEMIKRTRPTAIIGVPSFLRLIADKARETGFDLAGCPVTKIICIGEPVREPSFSLNASGRAIETAWGAKVYSTYGVTELANSLCECGVGAGGHLHEGQLHIEALDDSGQPVGEGEVGELVATTFGVEAMPLVRFRTGDCAALFRAACACGRLTPRVGPIVGRKAQKLKSKGTSLFPSSMQTLLEQTEGVEAFVIIARAENELSDLIEVLIHGAASIAAVRECFQARLRLAPLIRQASRQEIETLQMPPLARKRRTFVDLR